MKTKQNIWNNFDLYLQNVHQRRIETHEDGHLITYNEISAEEVNTHRTHFEKCWQDGISAHKALLFLGTILANANKCS